LKCGRILTLRPCRNCDKRGTLACDLRDRVGKGNGLNSGDGSLDATFKVTVGAGSGPAPSPNSSSRSSTAAAAGTPSPPPRNGRSPPPQHLTPLSSTPAPEPSTSPPTTAKASTSSPATRHPAPSSPTSKSGSAPSWPTAQAPPPTAPSAPTDGERRQSALLNNTSNDSVSFATSDGQTFYVFAGDPSNAFPAGTQLRLLARFADGTTATADTTIP